MKKFTLFLIIIFCYSCSSTTKIVSKDAALYEVLTQQSDGGGNIQFYEILSEPNEIKMLLNDESIKNKINENDIVKSNFVILNMGEKKSGGYTIGITKVEETKDNIVITVIENTPDENAIVTQSITYPYTILKINSKKELIIN